MSSPGSGAAVWVRRARGAEGPGRDEPGRRRARGGRAAFLSSSLGLGPRVGAGEWKREEQESGRSGGPSCPAEKGDYPPVSEPRKVTADSVAAADDLPSFPALAPPQFPARLCSSLPRPDPFDPRAVAEGQLGSPQDQRPNPHRRTARHHVHRLPPQ